MARKSSLVLLAICTLLRRFLDAYTWRSVRRNGITRLRATQRKIPSKSIKYPTILRPTDIASVIQGINGSASRERALDDLELSLGVRSSSTSMTAPVLADCIWSLGRNGAMVSTHPALTLTLLQCLYMQREAASAVHVAKTFVGLARMQAEWSDKVLPLSALYALLEASSPNLAAQGVSNVMWSLGAMHARVYLLPLATTIPLMRSLVRVSVRLTDQGIANSLWGLARMDSSWTELPLHVRSKLCSAVCRVSVRMSGQAVANTLHSLGTLGVYRDGLPERMLIAIEVSIRKSFERMSSKDITESVHGLSMMGFQWGHLSPKTKDCVAISVFKQVNKWSDDPVAALRDVSLLLFSLRTMRVSWRELPSGIRGGVLIALRSVCDFSKQFNEKTQFQAFGAYRKTRSRVAEVETVPSSGSSMLDSAHSFSTILHSLCKMNADLLSFPPDTRDSLYKCIGIFGEYLSPQGLAMTLYALGKMGVPFSSLPIASQRALGAAILAHSDSLDELSTSQVVFGLGSMSASWRILPADLKYCILQCLRRSIARFNPQMLSMSLSGLERMGCSYATDIDEPLRELLIEAFHSNAAAMSPFDLSLCLRGFGGMQSGAAYFTDLASAAMVFENIDSAGLVSCLHGICGVNAKWRELALYTRLSIWKAVLANSEDLTAEQLARVVHSLGQLETPWSSVTADNRLALTRLLASHIGCMDERGVGMSLSGLASMGAQWVDLAVDLQMQVKTTLCALCATSINASTLNSALVAAVKMRISDSSILAALSRCFDDNSSMLSSTEVASALLLLGKLPTSQPIADTTTFDRMFSRSGYQLSAHDSEVVSQQSLKPGIAALHRKLQVLVSAHVAWTDLKPSTRANALHELHDCLQLPLERLEFQSVVRVLDDLRTLQCEWISVSEDLRESILRVVSALHRSNSEQSRRFNIRYEVITLLVDLGCSAADMSVEHADDLVSMLACGWSENNYDTREVTRILTEFGASWSAISSESKRHIVVGIVKSLRRSKDPVAVKLISDCLVSVNCSWEALPTRPRNELSKCLGDISICDDIISMSVLELYKSLGAKWRMLTKDARSAALDACKLLDESARTQLLGLLEVPEELAC